jgi:hypothetical protein
LAEFTGRPQIRIASFSNASRLATKRISGHCHGQPQDQLAKPDRSRIREGTLLSLTVEEFCGLFRGSPAKDEATRRGAIDSIESAGNVACARLTLVHGPVTFSDWMLLLEVGGVWKIASKVYSTRPTT